MIYDTFILTFLWKNLFPCKLEIHFCLQGRILNLGSCGISYKSYTNVYIPVSI